MSDSQDHPRPGRPRLSSADRRGSRVVTMVTETELSHLRALAEDSGVSLSALCHELLFRATERVKRDL
ncbi:MAG: hypothetical protein AAGA28_13390 [Pseudomonadota bacterium]